MKVLSSMFCLPSRLAIYVVVFAVATAGCWPVLAQDAQSLSKKPGGVTFSKRLLMVSPNEGCAVGDINRDGHMDIVAGTHWFAGPHFVPYRLREIAEAKGRDVYLETNGDHLFDVDGDGWLDVVAGDWFSPEIHWYKNPGKKELNRGKLWRRQVLAKGEGRVEAYALKDLDGDGIPEIFANGMSARSPLVVWKFTKNDEGKPSAPRHVIGNKGNGHGFAFGDVNGDGREDILCASGWYERPEGEPFARPWKLHRETACKHASCPFIVVDLNGNGRSDLIVGNAHAFGLEWWEQGQPKADVITWAKHKIDDTWSQAHCLAWADIDGDGACELITGKRCHAHCGKDPGGNDPPVMYYYKWDTAAKHFTRYTIAAAGENVGTGMQICVQDLNDDGMPDIAVSGKTGTWILFNQGIK